MPTPPAPVTTTQREALATALATATSRTVHAVAPKVPIPPCLVIVADDPWLIPNRLGNPLRFEYRLKILAVERDNIEGLEALEETVEAVLTGLPGNASIAVVTPPMSTDIGAQGTVLVSEIKLSFQMKEA
jgi:hypothetical protein